MEPPLRAATLYLVATPIGNLQDITLRALATLKRVSVLACEDTRVTRKLLARYQLPTPPVLLAHHEHNENEAIGRILRHLREGRDVAVCTDAGMPGLSDPGYRLVAACAEAGLRVEVLPGASSGPAALAVSGLPTASCTFLGFGPRQPGKLRNWFAAEASAAHTLVFHESPRRLARSLSAAREALGDRRAAVCLELTKKFERVERGWLEDLAERFAAAPPPGEATVVVAGNHPRFCRAEATWTPTRPSRRDGQR